jgi:hypothetical protein
VFPASAADPTTTTERICLVFTGSRASEIESCGCSQKQSGGVDREAYLYEQLRKTYPNVIAIEAGAWTDPFQTPNERLKSDYLVRALREMQFRVFNVTPYDLAFGTTYPLQLARNGSGRLLSANVLSRSFDKASGTTTTKPLYAPYTILEAPRRDGRRPIRIGVIAVTHRESLDAGALQRLRAATRQMADYEVVDTSRVLRTLIPEVRKQADYVIVLAMMDRAVARQMAGIFEGADVVVTTWGVQALQEFMALRKATFVNAGYWGRYFVQALADFDADNRPIAISGGLKGIDSDGTASLRFAKLLADYREDTKNLARQIAVAMEQSRFAGRTQCLSCHNSAYLQWTRTPHNLAYATLAQKNQHYNPDCLPCHVTGYGEPDGFVDINQTGHLVSVQCETCHGPGRAHGKALTEMMKPDVVGVVVRPSTLANYPHLINETPEPLCLKCHVKDHDPNFNYARDLLLVSHKNTEGPFRRQPPASGSSATATRAMPTPAAVAPGGAPPAPTPSAPVPPPLTPKQWSTVR